jgi:hypothetical protein
MGLHDEPNEDRLSRFTILERLENERRFTSHLKKMNAIVFQVALNYKLEVML